MNKIGIYYAYWSKDWVVDFAKYVKKAYETGFDIVEFEMSSILSASEENQQRLAETLNQLDIDVTFCIGLSSEVDISSPDSKVRARGIKFMQQAVKKTAEFGGKILGGLNYGAWGAKMSSGYQDKTPYIERSAASLKEIMKTAEKYDVTCSVEVVNRFEQFMLNTSEEAREFVELVDSPYLGIHLDTFHMNIEEDSFSEAIKTSGDKLTHFHIGENNRKPPGEGNLIPWQETFTALSAIDYQGPVVMEPFMMAGGDVAQDIMLWREMNIENLDERARRSRKFIQGLIENS